MKERTRGNFISLFFNMRLEKMQLQKCPVCASQDIKFLMKKFDDRYGYKDDFSIYECKNCKCSFIKDPINPSSLWKLYEKYYGANNYSQQTKKTINTVSLIIKKIWVKKIIDFITWNISLWYFVKKWEKVLDYWCGTPLNAKLWNIARENRVGMEVNADLANSIKKQWYQCYVWTLWEISAIQEKFDVILMSQVIEHVYEPNLILSNAKKLLRPWWRIIISTPNFESKNKEIYWKKWINRHVPYHTILFSKKTFEEIAQNVWLKIKTYKTYTPYARHSYQTWYKIPAKGERNKTFKQSINPLKVFSSSFKLKIKNLLYKWKNDCILVILYKND